MRARVERNLAALRIVKELGDAPASEEQRAVLEQWTGWGAVSEVFDEQRKGWAGHRVTMQSFLTEAEYNAARRSTLNAHYTDDAVVAAMWDAWRVRAGEGPARVLEPGCGSGRFLRTSPAGVSMIGVEVDPITAAVAAKTSPHHRVRAESFADTTVEDLGGLVDGVIGNVPFSETKLFDAQFNPDRQHAMHNHFIIKALAMTRPGGTVALITSRYTLDAQRDDHRREMARLAHLDAAIRLPAGAHRSAGTDVVTDLLVFTRRAADDPGPTTDPAWIATRPFHADSSVRISAAFDANALGPNHQGVILGTAQITNGRFGPELSVQAESTLDLPTEITRAIATAPKTHTTTPPAAPAPTPVVTAPAVTAPRPPARTAAPASAPTAGPDAGVVPRKPRFAGELGVRTRAGKPEVVVATKDRQWGDPLDERIGAAHLEELASLIVLKDLHRAVLEGESASSDDTDELIATRAELKAAVERHHDMWGPINRATITPRTKMAEVVGDDGVTRTERVPALDEHGEALVTRRAPRAMAVFRKHDPSAVYVGALENFDEVAQTATLAAICTKRVLAPREPVTTASSPADAIAVCMDTQGRLDVETVADLLDIPAAQVADTLGDLAYTDPQTRQLVPAQEYLSGRVRVKLQQARVAAADDPQWQRNVDALTRVVPADLGPEDITARLGAVWIPATDVRDFAQSVFNDRTQVAYDTRTGSWKVSGGTRSSLLATEQFGTPKMGAHELLRRALNQTPVQIYDEVDDRKVLNIPASEAARDKQEELQQRFGEWIWENPERAQRLARAYNDRFNGTVPRRDFTYGTMTFPGLAENWTPRPHQANAVARVIANGSSGIFHPVGFGKTAVMTMAVMEQKRLGLVRKPAVVVPNHMLEQFSREFLQLYPGARVLAASTDDLTKERRRQFIARASTEDWDAIIMTRGAFYKLPASDTTLQRYLDQEVKPMRDWLTTNRDSAAASTVKQTEKQIQRHEEQIKECIAKIRKDVDQGVSFDETGIDYLAVDELHDFKNLATASSIPGAAIGGSKRATDLHAKVWDLRQRYGARAIVGATATPIANSITEMHVMTRYLNPEVLDKAGLTAFDAWAATFGSTVTKVEMSPDGGGLRERTRFAKFANVPELLTMWAEVGDALSPEQIASLPRPSIALNSDGVAEPEMIIAELSPELAEFIDQLGDRAQQISTGAIDPAIDNMLKVSSEGRRAALDMRLVPGDHGAPTTPTKVDAAAARIHQIWDEHKDRTYLAPDGSPHPTPGALQLVFCDLGTPNKEGRFSVYDDLRDKLIAHGIPRDQIAFMQDAKNDAEKARLFEAARTGKIQVLIGSTQTMGVGTNVQTRAAALHHLDCPWKPAELEQRDGRIHRQGNQNDPVRILRYATEGSFDAYMYQTVARKARFIDQIMSGNTDQREVEDIASDSTLTLEQMQMAIANNPLMQERTEVNVDVQRLRRQEAAHRRSQRNLTSQIPHLEHQIGVLTADLPRMADTLASIRDTSGERFTMRVDGRHHTTRAEAMTDLAQALSRRFGPPTRLQLGGLDWEVITRRVQGKRPGEWKTEYHATTLSPVPAVILNDDDIASPSPTTITRFENALRKAPTRAAEAKARLDALTTELDTARARHGQPFKHADRLTELSARLEDLDKRLKQQAGPKHDSANPALPQGNVTHPTPQQPNANPAFAPLTAAPAATHTDTTPAPARQDYQPLTRRKR